MSFKVRSSEPSSSAFRNRDFSISMAGFWATATVAVSLLVTVVPAGEGGTGSGGGVNHIPIVDVWLLQGVAGGAGHRSPQWQSGPLRR